MFAVVIPILSVIIIGYLYGVRVRPSQEAETLINKYVLYCALPAMIFLAVARATAKELQHGAFLGAGIIGIAVAYLLGLLLARKNGIASPASALTAMAASFGNTGYMGIPVTVAALGEGAAVPAALATLLHNIPVIFTVIMTFGTHSAKGGTGKAALLLSLIKAVQTVLANPLTLAALAGLVFVIFSIPLPAFLVTFTRFLGDAAAPTALFALGLSLARMRVREHVGRENLCLILPLTAVKMIVQPGVTLLAAVFLFGMSPKDVWLITAVVMAAQPVGAIVYLLSYSYKVDTSAVSLAIVLSSLVSVLSLPLILSLF